MTYHYHMTIKDITSADLSSLAKLLKAKATSIDLWNNLLEQKDRMITKYAKTPAALSHMAFIDMQDVKAVGHEILRYKVEKVHKELPNKIDGLYLECHIKVLDEELVPRKGFALSKNSNEGTKFYNCRIYFEEEIAAYRELIADIPNIISVQYETVISDSNVVVDEWWSKQ